MIEVPFWVLVVLEQLAFFSIVLAISYFLRSRRLKRYIDDMKVADKSINEHQRPVNQSSLSTKAEGTMLDHAANKTVNKLRERLAMAETRVKNLEKFRDLFFSLKSQFETMSITHAELSRNISNTQSNDPALIELKETLEKIAGEKTALEQELKQVEMELDVLMSDQAAQTLVARTDEVGSILQQQSKEIGRLVQIVADLEVEAAMAQRMQSSVNALESNSNELTVAVEILQDENQYLADQLQTLLKQENAKDAKLKSQLDSLTTQLQSKELEYDQLYKKYTDLESEYLKTRQ